MDSCWFLFCIMNFIRRLNSIQRVLNCLGFLISSRKDVDQEFRIPQRQKAFNVPELPYYTSTTNEWHKPYLNRTSPTRACSTVVESEQRYELLTTKNNNYYYRSYLHLTPPTCPSSPICSANPLHSTTCHDVTFTYASTDSHTCDT